MTARRKGLCTAEGTETAGAPGTVAAEEGMCIEVRRTFDPSLAAQSFS